MKKVKSIFAVCMFSFLLFGCTKEDWQEAAAGAQCDVNRTAVVIFENRSASGTSYDVYWNNVRVAQDLKPGKKTKAAAYNVGTNTYIFRKSGTNITTCAQGYPNLAQCQSYTFWCEN